MSVAGAPSARQRATRLLRIRFVVLLAIVAAWLSLPYLPLPGLPLCAFQKLAGIPCPGCGMTRSVTLLASGDIGTALQLHPLGGVLVGGLVAATAAAGVALVSPRDALTEITVRYGPWLVAGLAVTMIAVWIVRAFVVPGWAPPAIDPFVPSVR